MWTPLAPAIVLVLAGTLQPAAAQSDAPSALELALADYRCSAQRFVPDSEPYHECVSATLQEIRDDFGRDLSRLSTGERRSIDRACGRISASLEREAYLQCVDAQLLVIRRRRTRATARSKPPSNAAVDVVPVLPGVSPPLPPLSPRRSPLPWVALAVGMAGAAGGGAFVVVRKKRRARRTCHTCGRDVPGGGDLCPACRFEAAEALRHAAAQRAEEARQQDEERRRQAEREEEQRQAQARHAEDSRRQALEREREAAEEHRRLEAERREEEARQRRAIGAEPAGDTFDPYAILGVPPGATLAAVEAAYNEGRAKYAPEQVADMGFETQRVYAGRLNAVERAWKAISAARGNATESDMV